jgi:MFS family permease
MLNNLLTTLASFFPSHLPRQLRDLYLTVSIGNLAVSAVMIFEPIYLFQLGYSIPVIIAFYATVYILYFCLMPWGGALAMRFGYTKMIVASSLFLIAFYAAFIGLASSVIFFPLAAIFYALQKSLYWPSFYYGFTLYGRDEEEGREVGNLEVVDVIVSAIGPFLGGLLLLLSNFNTLFVVASLIILIAHLPLLLTQTKEEAQPFSVGDCYRRLVNPEKRRLVVSILGYGEEFVALTLWPLFIYIAFVPDLFSLGSLVALTTGVTVIVILYIGRLTDQTNKREVLRTASVLYAFLWGMRLFLSGVGSVFMIDTMSRLTKRMLKVPQMSIVLERARHRHHIMATSILFEMSLVVGKILAMILIGLFFLFIPQLAWPLTFLVAASFTLLYAFL